MATERSPLSLQIYPSPFKMMRCCLPRSSRSPTTCRLTGFARLTPSLILKSNGYSRRWGERKQPTTLHLQVRWVYPTLSHPSSPLLVRQKTSSRINHQYIPVAFLHIMLTSSVSVVSWTSVFFQYSCLWVPDSLPALLTLWQEAAPI